MKVSPLVSVIMPAYNAQRYVGEAVESVLAQTYPHLELICIDDGSTDKTRAILASFGERVTLISLEGNRGIAEARNAGIRVAQGTFLAFMDADDVWEPNKIAEQIARFDARPELDISFTHMQCFISPELDPATKDLRYCPPNPVPGYLPPTAVVRTSSFERVGLFEPKWRVGEFIDWFMRAREEGLTYELLDTVLLRRRIHETNTGITDRPSRVDYVRIAREALKRRRGESSYD